jgi:hypothetical protein
MWSDLMLTVNTSDFTVDSAERSVRHTKSGVVVWFYEYENPEDWLKADSLSIGNPDLCDGDINDLAAGAKRAALAAGMTHRKP